MDNDRRSRMDLRKSPDPQKRPKARAGGAGHSEPGGEPATELDRLLRRRGLDQGHMHAIEKDR